MRVVIKVWGPGFSLNLCPHTISNQSFPSFVLHLLPMFHRWGLYDLGLGFYADLLYCQSALASTPARFSVAQMWPLSLFHHLHWILMAYCIKTRCHPTSTPFQIQLLHSSFVHISFSQLTLLHDFLLLAFSHDFSHYTVQLPPLTFSVLSAL